MAEATHSLRIPPGAACISRNATAAGTLYTVPAGRRLHIVSIWASGMGGAAAGSIILTATPEFSGGGTSILRLELGTSTNAALSNPCHDIPIAAGGTVVSSTAGTVPISLCVGFTAWEEATTV